MKDQNTMIDLAIVALGAGLAESQAGRVSRKDYRPLVVASVAAGAAAIAPYISDALVGKPVHLLGAPTLTPTEKLASDVVSAAVVAALASYVADRSRLSGYAKAAAVGLASAAGVWLGHEMALRFLATPSGTARPPKMPFPDCCPKGYKAHPSEEDVCVPIEGGGLFVKTKCEPGTKCIQGKCSPIV